MGEQLTVRLFVRTQTYDIPCDPRQPAKWLLQQAKGIQRSTQKQLGVQQTHPEDELEVLFNRSTRQVIDLAEPIGASIAATDVVDARTLLQTPDTTYNSALFPWLRSYPGGLQLSDEVMGSSNGLFFQQLYAFTLIGKRTPLTASERKKKQDQESFLALLETYVLGSYDHSSVAQQQQQQQQHPYPHAHQHANGLQQHELYQYRNSHATHSAPTTPHHSTGLRPSTPPNGRRGAAPTSPPMRHSAGALADLNNFSDSSSDNTDDSPSMSSSSYPTRAPDYATPPPRTAAMPTVPAPSVRRVATETALDGFDSVFDIVFKQQAIGMKLGADETKRFAVVKECFEGSEAKRYPEIQSGVVILAVNGQEVTGLGLSRVLYRLREAPRPVVVRFGRLPPRQYQQPRTGTWG